MTARASEGRPTDPIGLVMHAARSSDLLHPDGPVVVMLSGGRDSVCMLDVARTLCGVDAVHALHVNYQLREQADEDERHCTALCEQFGIALEIFRPRRDRDGGNLQAWARDQRYRVAGRLAQALRPHALIATGHTASDQVETILYRLASSPGRRALLGMRPRDGQLVRPLLEVTRQQTAAYCRARSLLWREDATNESEDFARGRVRMHLVPALRSIHPAAESNVLRTAALLREETELLDELVQDALAGRTTIEIDRLAALPAALARLIVVDLAERACGGYVPQAGARVAEILELAHRQGHGELHIGGLVSAVVDAGELRMVAIPRRYPSPKETEDRAPGH